MAVVVDRGRRSKRRDHFERRFSLPNSFRSSLLESFSTFFRLAGRFRPARFMKNTSMDIADRYGSLLRRRLTSADFFSDRAIRAGSFQENTPVSRSSALLCLVTVADHFPPGFGRGISGNPKHGPPKWEPSFCAPVANRGGASN